MSTSWSASRLQLFDKLFEESGTLGKGVTVGKIQVALMESDRSRSSIFGVLEEQARNNDEDPSPEDLARMAQSVCLALLRKKDNWMAACSDSQWFSRNDAGKAESKFNEWANREAYKFEKVGHK